MIIKVDKDICQKIESLQYEVESRKDIIATVLAGNFTMKSDKFNAYHAEYQEYFKKYNQAKQEMMSKYIDVSLKDKPWNLTFDTQELLIEE